MFRSSQTLFPVSVAGRG